MLDFVSSLWTWTTNTFPWITLFYYSIGFLAVWTYLARVLPGAFLYKPRDLKALYKAEWAIVTGASSGIGKAISEKLASQGVNVVLAALDDQLLKDTTEELRKRFPALSFRPVGVDLSAYAGGQDYLATIIENTKDIPVSLIFNNAGYITTGLFADLTLDRQLKNLECNSTSAVKISHHFINRLINEKRRGLVTFTSSSGGFMPSPMAAIYGSSKALMTEFATSIACEVKDYGIDVVVVHPSPINSRFYDNAGRLDMLKFFKATAVSPAVIADCIFSSAGRAVVCDQGYFSIGVKLMLKAVDWNFLSDLIPHTFKYNSAFQSLKVKRD